MNMNTVDTNNCDTFAYRSTFLKGVQFKYFTFCPKIGHLKHYLQLTVYVYYPYIPKNKSNKNNFSTPTVDRHALG